MDVDERVVYKDVLIPRLCRAASHGRFLPRRGAYFPATDLIPYISLTIQCVSRCRPRTTGIDKHTCQGGRVRQCTPDSALRRGDTLCVPWCWVCLALGSLGLWYSDGLAISVPVSMELCRRHRYGEHRSSYRPRRPSRPCTSSSCRLGESGINVCNKAECAA